MYNLDLNVNKTKWQNFKYDIGNVFGGVGHAYSRPLHWKKKQWTNFGYTAVGTASLFFVDDEFNGWVDGFRSDVPRWLANYGNDVAAPGNNYMITSAVYLTGLFTDNEKLRIANLAEKFNISKSYFSEYFKKQAEINLAEYVLKTKLKIVETEVTHSNLSLKELALQLNFTDSSHLAKTFKKTYGTTIKQFKNNICHTI